VAHSLQGTSFLTKLNRRPCAPEELYEYTFYHFLYISLDLIIKVLLLFEEDLVERQELKSSLALER
jgi:hypothetical protein